MVAGQRGGTGDQARAYREKGHAVALSFALSIGLDKDYQNDQQAKKDVIDPSGDAHSVKSGEKKWQIFLYRRSRFETDDGFQALNGIGSLLIHCIDAFPPRFKDYEANKEVAKKRLRTPMRELKDRFQRKALLRAFLMKSFFNGGEVNYLTIHRDDMFKIYHNADIVRTLGEALTVENSKSAPRQDLPEQKVIFKHAGRNVGELEMRNDSERHYGEVRFNVNILPFMALLDAYSTTTFKKSKLYLPKVTAYGKAVKTFGNWLP